MAQNHAARLEGLQDSLRERGKLLKTKDEMLERAVSLLQETKARADRAEDKAIKANEAYKQFSSGERIVVTAIGGGIVGSAVVLGVNAAVGGIAKYSEWVKRNEGYIAGTTEIVLGAGAGTAAILLRGNNPGLPSDIAFGASATTATFGVGKVAKTWWDRRKAAQDLMKQLVEERARLAAQAAAVQQQQAAAAQQQRANG